MRRFLSFLGQCVVGGPIQIVTGSVCIQRFRLLLGQCVAGGHFVTGSVFMPRFLINIVGTVCCKRSIRDWLCFYAEILIIFSTV